jgi:hypothetical protein
MRAQELEESSGYSFEGSWTPDLVFSKLWLAREFKNILAENQVDVVPVIYVLGSWWGNMSVILDRAAVPVEKIINVDSNAKWLRGSQQLTRAMNINNVQAMKTDVNQLDYRQLTGPSVVINASLNDIQDRGWFEHIPNGTLVVLQGRDQADSKNVYHSLRDILDQYPLDSVLYQGTMKLQDPETAYRRHMVIGVKGQQQLDELTFLGSPCTKDCSGHRAGYAWSKARGGIQSASWSRSFNNGAALAAAGR